MISFEKSFGGSGNDVFYDVVELHDKGYLLVGASMSTDIAGNENKGKFDGWILKLDSAFNVQWQKLMGLLRCLLHKHG